MASELSNYLANAVLNYLDGDAMPTAPTDVYVALFNGDPTATGSGGTEVTTTIRVAGRLAVAWGAVASRACSNSADIDFGLAAGGATVTHAALFDASAAGNMLMYSPLDTTRVVVAGDPVVIPTGDLSANFN
jgi:hypothetical protein